MSISSKDRAQINAALVCIQMELGDAVNAVQQQAKNLMAAGRSPQAAYKQVVGGVMKTNPALGATIQRVTRLIDKSDSETVAKYNDAMVRFNETGDQAHLDALEPMMRQDAVALAVKDGTVSSADAAAGKVDWESLGFDAGAEASQSFKFEAPSAAPQLADRPAQPEHKGSIRTAPNSPFSNQVGVSSSPTGIRTGAAAERWARAERVTYGDSHTFARPSFTPQQSSESA